MYVWAEEAEGVQGEQTTPQALLQLHNRKCLNFWDSCVGGCITKHEKKTINRVRRCASRIIGEIA